MSVKKVRDTEAARKKSVAETLYYNVTVVPSGELDSVAMGGIRQQSAGKDIARVGDQLVIGPFENRAEAASLVEFVQVMGYGQVTLDAIKKN